MTNDEFDKLESDEERLWSEVEALKAPLEAKTAEWGAVRAKLDRERVRREVASEMVAAQPN